MLAESTPLDRCPLPLPRRCSSRFAQRVNKNKLAVLAARCDETTVPIVHQKSVAYPLAYLVSVRALALGCAWALVLMLAAPSAGATSFPLKQSADGRYLVDQNDLPFRVQSDAAWLMSTRGSATDVDSYLADRKAKGFNAFVLMAI